jgi:hypothetical protein
VIIFEDYDKGVLDEKVIAEIIRQAENYAFPSSWTQEAQLPALQAGHAVQAQPERTQRRPQD